MGLLPISKLGSQANLNGGPNGALKAMWDVKDLEVKRCASRACPLCKWLESFRFRRELQDQQQRICNKREGICLECVRTNRKSYEDKTCRFKHDD